MNLVSGQTGWQSFDDRSKEQMDLHHATVSMLPAFSVTKDGEPHDFGPTGSNLKSQIVKAAKDAGGGHHIPTLHQFTGSCVMMGAWTATMYNSAVDIVVRGDLEQLVSLCLLPAYGLSRKLSGIRGSGDGSTGSGMAKALLTGGVCRNDDPSANLPLPTTYRRSLTWGASNETRYSLYSNAPAGAIAASKAHLVQTASPLGSYKEVRDSLLAGYPCTMATGNPGVDPSRTTMKNGHLFLSPGPRTDHQQALIEVDDDAQYPGVLVMNSWTVYCYLKGENDPRLEKGEMDDGTPLGSVWWTPEMIDQACRQGEVYAMGAYPGYEIKKLPYNIVSG